MPPEAQRPIVDRRRTQGARPGGRSARVVADVLSAASQELGRVGFAALRVEDVALRSGVAKTTIYRRWPTKTALVEAVIASRGEEPPLEDTGDLRADLLRAILVTVERLAVPERAGLIRMLQAERDNPEAGAIAKALRTRHRAAREALVTRAVARGALPAGTDTALVTELVLSTVYARLLHHGEPVDPGWIARVIDLVLAGAEARAPMDAR